MSSERAIQQVSFKQGTQDGKPCALEVLMLGAFLRLMQSQCACFGHVCLMYALQGWSKFGPFHAETEAGIGGDVLV